MIYPPLSHNLGAIAAFLTNPADLVKSIKGFFLFVFVSTLVNDENNIFALILEIFFNALIGF